MLILLQESPFWLVKKERIEEAENALLALRGPQYEMKYELEEMKSLLAKQQGNDMSLTENLKQLRSRAIFMPVLVVLVMLMLQVLYLIVLRLQFCSLCFSASEWMRNGYILFFRYFQKSQSRIGQIFAFNFSSKWN